MLLPSHQTDLHCSPASATAAYPYTLHSSMSEAHDGDEYASRNLSCSYFREDVRMEMATSTSIFTGDRTEADRRCLLPLDTGLSAGLISHYFDPSKDGLV